jgi:hypothetical protein
MPTLPNITQGQMALDPLNQIIYYKTESNELKSVTLKWLQESSDTIDTTDSVTVGGDFVITGNLTVNGTTVTLNTESILVEDNFLVLNSNVTGTPSTNSGLEIERGTSPNVIIRWNEGSDRWEFTDTDSSSGPWYPLVKSTDDLTEGSTNLFYTNERAQDTVNDALTAGTGVSKVYNDGLNTITISIGQPVGTTDNVIFNQVTADLVGDVTGTVSNISNHGISDLSDVNITDPADGNFLRYDGSNWFNDPVNLATDTIGDYVAKLAAGTGITITNNSGEAATPNISFSGSIDNLSDVDITSAADGQILEFNGTNWVNSVRPSNEPMGHEDKSESTISFNEGTRTFSIAPVSTFFTVWCAGKRFVKTGTETVEIPDTSGLYYIYFNSSGVLSYRTDYFVWDEDAPTAYVYWNEVDNKAYFFADERHGITLDWATHEYLHRTRGAAIANGFGANNYIINGNGSLDSHAKLDIANGTFFDEDLQVDISHSATPTPNTWEQVLQGNAEIPVFYRLNNHWTKDVATEFPLKQGASRPQYNLNTAGTWSATDIANNRFGVSWIIATNNLNEPIIAVLGQGSYTDNGSAEAEFYGSLNLDGFPIVEFRPLYKIIYECKDSYSNTPSASFTSIVDLRSVIAADQGIGTTAVSDHGSMTGLSDDDHTQYLNDTRHNSLDHSTALGTASISDLSDVAISSAVEGQGLVWSGESWVNTSIPLQLDGLTDVVITSATPNQVLKFDGTNWVNDESPSSIAGTTYSTVTTDTVNTAITVTHNLSTRNIVVSLTEETSPYGSVNAHWEATDLNTVTIYFATPPGEDGIRINIYAAVSGLPFNYGTTYTSIIGDSVVKDFTITHNLGTRDVFVQFINANSPYEQYNVAWEAYTADSIKAYFAEAPTSNSVRVVIYSSLSGELINLNLNDLEDVSALGATPEQFLKWDGTNWVNTFSIDSIKIDDGITIYSSSTPSGLISTYGPILNAGQEPLIVASNFPLEYEDSKFPMAYISSLGQFNGDSLKTYSNSTGETILDSLLPLSGFGPYSAFNIKAKGNIYWEDAGDGAQASLVFSGTFSSPRLTFDANITIDAQRSLTSQFTYNNSVGAVRDVFITSSGLLGVNLSSQKYKEDIVNISIDPQKVYQIQPVEFKYKEGHINEEAQDQRFIGLIAEQLDEIGLTQFVEYDEDGTPDSVKYSMLSLALIETVKDLNTRLLNLENK